MASADATGVWVDGFPASAQDAEDALWQSLTRADVVAIVLSEGVSEPRSVTLAGVVAREMLGRALNVGAGRSTGAGGEL